MLEKINLTEKLASFKEQWSPKVIGEVNDATVKLAKLQGEFVWHSHANEDELFLIVKGKLLIKLRDQDIYLNEGECVIIPKGVEHLPIADEECHVLFFEPNTTLNTGDIRNERTVEVLEKI
jgi:mannose-6-phosphate isomerase-like protein (cupin superfamily)